MESLFEPDLELEIGLTGIREGPRWLSLALTLPLFLGLLASFSLWRFRPEAPRKVSASVSRQVDVVLEPGAGASPRQAPPSPTPGDPLGNGTVDPALLKAEALRPDLPKVTAFTPDLTQEPPRTLPEGASLPLLPQGLPVAPGGNGMARGSGGAAAPAPKPPPRRLQVSGVEADELRAVHQPIPVIRNARKGLGGTVVVRVRIGADGVPVSATPLSGPEEVFAQITAAVLQWRFHVPERLRPEAPIRLDVKLQLSYL
jgi:hypothetical protein